MRILAVDPDHVGGWAVVSVVAGGAKPVVHRSGVLGRQKGTFEDSPTAREIYDLISGLGHLDAVVVEYVSENKKTSPEVLRQLHEMALRWVVVGELIVGDVVRIQPQRWRSRTGVYHLGRKDAKIKKAIRDAAHVLTESIDPKKAALREKGLNPYQDSESDAVCMAVAYFLGQDKFLEQETEGEAE